MRKIEIQNPQIEKTYKTLLGADYVSGTTLSVVNTNVFAVQDIIIVGEPGEELTEIKELSGITPNKSFSIATDLKFAHSKGTSIYKVPWNQIVIETRATNNDSFTTLTTLDIQYDDHNNTTIYYDQSGTDTTGYRFRFHNSVNNKYSSYSPTLVGSGFVKNQVGYMIKQIRKVVNDEEKNIVTDDEIIRFLNRAQDITYAHNPRYWFLFYDSFQRQNGIPTVDNQAVYSLDKYETYGHLDIVRYYYEFGATKDLYPLKREDSIIFDLSTIDQTRGKSDWVSAYKLLPPDTDSQRGYIQIEPVPDGQGTGIIYPNFYQIMPQLENVESKTMVPLPHILEDFAISQIERIKGNENKAQQYLDIFLGPKDQRGGFENITGLKLLDKMDNAQKRAVGQPRSLKTFYGQDPVSHMFGAPRYDRDFLRENYF